MMEAKHTGKVVQSGKKCVVKGGYGDQGEKDVLLPIGLLRETNVQAGDTVEVCFSRLAKQGAAYYTATSAKKRKPLSRTASSKTLSVRSQRSAQKAPGTTPPSQPAAEPAEPATPALDIPAGVAQAIRSALAAIRGSVGSDAALRERELRLQDNIKHLCGRHEQAATEGFDFDLQWDIVAPAASTPGDGDGAESADDVGAAVVVPAIEEPAAPPTPPAGAPSSPPVAWKTPPSPPAAAGAAGAGGGESSSGEDKIDAVLDLLKRSRKVGGTPSACHDREAVAALLAACDDDPDAVLKMVEEGHASPQRPEPTVAAAAAAPPPAAARDAEPPADVQTVMTILHVSREEAERQLTRHGSLEAAVDAGVQGEATGSDYQVQRHPPTAPGRAAERPAAPRSTTVPRGAANTQEGRNFFVIRHGQRADDPSVDTTHEWDKPNKPRPYDCPLTPYGKQQSRDIGETVAKLIRCSPPDGRETVILTSPYLRCIETALEIAHVLGAEVKVMTELSETYPPSKKVFIFFFFFRLVLCLCCVCVVPDELGPLTPCT